ncbi:bifunctional phosphoribosylaminoimidazolecarboxamide formyltransferase/IMP cyclohydrolase [Thermoanaerobacterium thermosaccharolyticum]|uniref:Bifunctional purine biosynthesis protein PurH n=1 Tax=Thermoanaerobacterium thermosaccharolyticum M0795 TaxID=698948 RepID=L0IP54_THETR|nr:bifunctional phosphoribosylaminoimidazolecarboxamide formyltransferase/IMP cyclohydrolase [Thermoanaerobacterium thermosaccharolyticum]AGB19762.1 phosphoribosylaminoimidazolecarboxamide formyltransferase/IMP cyclohydrolase [Thermoanaerobacterium thermosaccharolyticum M0795]
MSKRALISVSKKDGILDFAKSLDELGVEILSTGGTYKLLCDNGIKAIKVSDITGFPEILDGRVKTLHPKIHGGLLAIRDDENHMKQLNENGIEPIDIVAVNLYPFKETILKDDVMLEDAIENIDIGGPSMIRAAAKNYKYVTVLVDPSDYTKVIEEIKEYGNTKEETRFYLAMKAFGHTASYDSLIYNYLLDKNGVEFPDTITLSYEKSLDMRYGENPHQKAAFYKNSLKSFGISECIKLHGKELSFNNINDANAAIELLKEFDVPAAVAIKHTNPCGVAVADNIYDAFKKAYECDSVSIFGGIVAFNRTLDKRTAEELSKIFLEIIIAPDFDEDALNILEKKKNVRILKLKDGYVKEYDVKKVEGGILVQEKDEVDLYEDKLKVVTKNAPDEKEFKDLRFAWKVVKHVKSNAIVLAKDGATVGIGAGQVNRIWPTQQSIKQAGEKAKGSVLASDAFFPFPDVVEAAAKAGVASIIQPGGSKNDEASIDAADKAGISMVFTGIRHFKH